MLIERGDKPPEVEQINKYDKIDVAQDGELLAVFSAERKYAMGAKSFKTAMTADELSASIDRVSDHLERVQKRLEDHTGEEDFILTSNFNDTQYVLAEMQTAQAEIMSIPEGLVDRIREQAQDQLLQEQRDRGFFERVSAAITNE